MSTMNEFGPYSAKNGCFIVKNINECKKTIKIFNFPIPFNRERNLLMIKGVAEADIRASLLKGELRHKILAKEITITCSDIDLLQFNDDQKQFLEDAGIVKGLEVDGSGNIKYLWRQEIPLIGTKDGTNRIFLTPEVFLYGVYEGNIFHIDVSHNGKRVFEGIDYKVIESSGVGTGYDGIQFTTFIPVSRSVLMANYTISV